MNQNIKHVQISPAKLPNPSTAKKKKKQSNFLRNYCLLLGRVNITHLRQQKRIHKYIYFLPQLFILWSNLEIINIRQPILVYKP
jgi:hypothetical protein